MVFIWINLMDLSRRNDFNIRSFLSVPAYCIWSHRVDKLQYESNHKPKYHQGYILNNKKYHEEQHQHIESPISLQLSLMTDWKIQPCFKRKKLDGSRSKNSKIIQSFYFVACVNKTNYPIV